MRPCAPRRITYVGELGWELYIPTEFAAHVYDAIVAEGGPFGLRLAGYHALESLRMEKAYRAWGTDLTDLDTPLEAGLRFAVAFDKPDFIGKGALTAQAGRAFDEAPGGVHAGRPRAAAARRRADLPRRRARRAHDGRRLRPHDRPLGGHGIRRERGRRRPGLRPCAAATRSRSWTSATRRPRLCAPPTTPGARAYGCSPPMPRQSPAPCSPVRAMSRDLPGPSIIRKWPSAGPCA